jgi:hypothetical protein
LENKLIEQLTNQLRDIDPGICITVVKSFIGENFWSFEVNNGTTRGSGAAMNPTIALQKAISEYIERCAVKQFAKSLQVKTSSGFASHLSLTDAHQSSRSELIERDVLLTCWFADISPCWIPLGSIQIQDDLLMTIENIEKLGVKFKLGILGKGLSDFVAVGMIDFDLYSNRQLSWAFATESDLTLPKALQKTAISLIRIANLIVTRRLSGQKLFRELLASDISKPEDHLEYYLNPIHRSNLLEWWHSQNASVLDVGDCKIESRKLETELSLKLGRYVSFSRSDELIPYFAGVPINTDQIAYRIKNLGLHLRRNFEEIHPLS